MENLNIKSLIKQCVRESIQEKKKLLLEFTYEDTEKELEIELSGKHFLVKGIYTCEVSMGQGGFEHDIPFGIGKGYQRSQEAEVESEEFVVHEVFLLTDQGTPGKSIDDPKIKIGIQNYINKQIEFKEDQDKAIEAAYNSGS